MIVGLGNPGKAYARHRHNLGFMVIDEIAREQHLSWKSNKEKTLVCQTRIENIKILLAKPQTYMNRSGKSLAPILKRLGLEPSSLVVVHDDLDLALGNVRIKVGGGDGGHRGVKSIADSLSFRDFMRIRLGIGRPPEGVLPEEFVLRDFIPEERPILEHLVLTGSSAVHLLALHGVEYSKNIIHSVKPPLDFLVQRS